mgnify:CR=1 FL=1
MEKKIVTFGEIMLRLSPEGHYRFVQADRFLAEYGGGEANVAVSLAGYGHAVQFVTKLPKNDLGQAAFNSLRRYGVDTSQIQRGGNRLGVYFLEKGASQRPSRVIYDRADSAIAGVCPDEFDFSSIFKDAHWFHFTGITPALGENAAVVCLRACEEAKRRGITVSCDLNYRKNLWSTAQAEETMGKLMPYVDVCIANEEDAEKVFGIRAANTDVNAGTLDGDGYVQVARLLTERFGFRYVAITLRKSFSADDNEWGAMLYADGESIFSRKYSIHLVDRVGGGDSFAAGLVHGLSSGMKKSDALEFATAASCLKQTIVGDFNHVSVEEVEALKCGDGSGRVRR